MDLDFQGERAMNTLSYPPSKVLSLLVSLPPPVQILCVQNCFPEANGSGCTSPELPSPPQFQSLLILKLFLEWMGGGWRSKGPFPGSPIRV